MRKEKTLRVRRQLWWNDTLNRMKREVMRARKNYQRARRSSIRGPALTPDVLETRRQYRSLEKLYGKSIQTVKAEDWRRFVGDSGNNNPWGAVYRICRGRSATDIGCMRKGDGSLTTTWCEAASVLLTKFLPRHDETEEYRDHATPHQPEHRPITESEITAAIARAKPKKAPGLDGKRADIGSTGHLYRAF